MIVCVCRRITDHQIRQAAADGAVSLECLQFELGVATQCGRCADCASHVLCDARAAKAANGESRVAYSPRVSLGRHAQLA